MLVKSAVLLLSPVLLSVAAIAQTPSMPVPLQLASAPAGISAARCTLDHAGIHALAAYASVHLTGLPLADGGTLELDLTRVDVARREFRFYVDDVERPGLLDGLGLTVWKGSVHGDPQSSVSLSFSHVGVRGWIRVGGELVHVLARPGANDDWSNGDVLIADEAAILRTGARMDFSCQQEQVSPTTPAARMQPAPSGTQSLGVCSLREAKVSLTTDFPLFQRFNNLAAETAYVAGLFSLISDQYETQVNTVMTFPYVAFYTTSNDPWTATSSGAALDELALAWASGIPNGGQVGQLVSGAGLGGGVGYLAALCGTALSVAGNMTGTTPMPIVQGPANWDFIVCAHEIGHNFGAPHTHEFCPPLDQCPPSQYWGSCQTAQVCTNQGTIMSYCHLCSGGTSNVIPVFHTGNIPQMLVQTNCLPFYVRVIGTHPQIFTPDVPTAVTAQLLGDPSGVVRVYYRYYGGPFTVLTMNNTGPGTYAATLPPVSCDATPELYYEAVGTCTPSRDPELAPAVYSAFVGASQLPLDDNFQTDLGWTASVNGATAGFWQRGVPVNDPGSAYDPPADADGSGSCYVTGNTTGNSDVDNGSVTLMSPSFDLVGSNQSIQYSYWLRLQNAGGVDHLFVEVSSAGAGGPWTQIANHTTDSSLWRSNVISAADLSAAGVPRTATMRMRFTINDSNPQGMVEAGIDAFRVSKVACSSLSTSFCRGDGSGSACPCGNTGFAGRGCANSVWNEGGGLAGSGVASVANDTLLLTATSLTGATSIFLQSDATMAAVAIDDGLGCVTGSVIRLGTKSVPQNTSVFPEPGDPLISVRGAIPPAGGTRYYQTFYRNAAVFCTSATSNRTNGLAIVWAP